MYQPICHNDVCDINFTLKMIFNTYHMQHKLCFFGFMLQCGFNICCVKIVKCFLSVSETRAHRSLTDDWFTVGLCSWGF